MVELRHVHLIAAKHVLRYLKSTIDYGLRYVADCEFGLVVLVSLSLSWFAWSICVLCLSLMSTVVFDCGLVPGSGPLWSPSCVLECVLSGRPFPQIQAQV